MARIMISNNQKRVNYFNDFSKNVGFNDFNLYNGSNFYLSVHKKKIHKIENFVELDNGDFCSVVGTCIVGNKTGTDALKELYINFNNDIEAMRTELLGNYIVCIKKFGKIYIFTDKYQVLKSYYQVNDSGWIFSNRIENIAMSSNNLKVNEFGLLQESMLVSAFGKETMFEDISRLFGYEYIEIDCKTNVFTIKEVTYKRKRRDFANKTIEEAASEYSELIKKRFTTVSNVFGDQIRIHQTGGLDNRTVFAGFLSTGVKPDILYGVGNSVLSNTKDEDLNLCKKYAEKYNIDLYKMDWRESYVGANKEWSTLFDKYGFLYSLYGGARNFFKEYEGNIPNYPTFMECGYFLENLRLREFISESKKKTITVEYFVEKYLLGSGYGIVDENLTLNFSEFKSKLVSLLQEKIKIYGIEPKGIINEQNFDEVRWIHARHTDSLLVNFLNDFSASIAMFSIEELHEFPFDVPADWRRNAKFQLMVINSLNESVLEIPIFSHCQRHQFDKSKFKLKAEVTVAQKISKFLKEIGISEKTYKKIASVYHLINSPTSNLGEVENVAELKIYIDDIVKEYAELLNIPLNSKNNQSSLVYLMLLAQCLYGINHCKEKANDFKIS